MFWKSLAANIWTNSIDSIREIALGGPSYLALKKVSSPATQRLHLRWKANADTTGILEEFAQSLRKKVSQIDLDLAIRYSAEGLDQESYKKLIAYV